MDQIIHHNISIKGLKLSSFALFTVFISKHQMNSRCLLEITKSESLKKIFQIQVQMQFVLPLWRSPYSAVYIDQLQLYYRAKHGGILKKFFSVFLSPLESDWGRGSNLFVLVISFLVTFPETQLER